MGGRSTGPTATTRLQRRLPSRSSTRPASRPRIRSRPATLAFLARGSRRSLASRTPTSSPCTTSASPAIASSLTMEFVEGPTLRQYSRRRPAQLAGGAPAADPGGAGPPAAHRGGVIHRDIKPDTHPRRRRRPRPRRRLQRRSPAGQQRRDPRRQVPPHRHRDQCPRRHARVHGPRAAASFPACPRSDQFAFCVTAYECLFGERPFAGPTLRTLIDNVLAGPPTPAAPVLAADPPRPLPVHRPRPRPRRRRSLARHGHPPRPPSRPSSSCGQRRSSLVLAASLGAAAALTLGAAAAHYTGSSCSHPELAAHISASLIAAARPSPGPPSPAPRSNEAKLAADPAPEHPQALRAPVVARRPSRCPLGHLHVSQLRRPPVTRARSAASTPVLPARRLRAPGPAGTAPSPPPASSSPACPGTVRSTSPPAPTNSIVTPPAAASTVERLAVAAHSGSASGPFDA